MFSPLIQEGDKDVSTRMFAPRYGRNEEAGTGMAAGPLACCLFDKLNMKKRKYFIQQGKYMDSPSISLIIIDLEIVEDEIISLMAGGRGVSKAKWRLNFDE